MVKTHEWGPHCRSAFQASILLLRHPAESILSEFNRRSGGHVGHASSEKFRKEGGKTWIAFVKSKAKEWEEMNSDWLLNFPRPLLILHYNKLCNEVEASLVHVLTFLGVSVTKEQLACAMTHQEGIYRRKRKKEERNILFGQELSTMLEERWDRVETLAATRLMKEETPL